MPEVAGPIADSALALPRELGSVPFASTEYTGTPSIVICCGGLIAVAGRKNWHAETAISAKTNLIQFISNSSIKSLFF